jgi:hypothetical protein
MHATRVKALVLGAFALGLVTGWSTGALEVLAQAAAACVQGGPTGQTVALNGSGAMDTPPVTLASGTYRVVWQGDRPCIWSAELRPVGGGQHAVPLWSASEQLSGEAWAYDVPASTYYLHMVSDCATWSVTLEPQA